MSYTRLIILLMSASVGIGDACYAQTSPVKETPTTQPGSSPTLRKLTIKDSVAIALSNSKSLQLSAEGIHKAHSRVEEAKTGFMPSLNSTSTLTHLDESSSFSIAGPDGKLQSITIVKQDQKQLNLSAQLPIDIVGFIGAAVHQAEFAEIAARLEQSRVKNQTISDVKAAYYDLLRAKEFVAVADQAVVNGNDRLKIAKLNLQYGTGTKFDVLRADTEVANAKQNLIAAKNRVNLTTALLNNAMGLDQNTPLETAKAMEEGAAPSDFNKSVDEAYKLRPEVLQSDANIKSAQVGIKIAQRSALPTLSAGANFQYTPDAGGFAPKTTSWAAVATLQFPIFEQGATKHRVNQAKADVNSAKLNKQITLDGIALEVRQTFLNLIEAQDRLNVTSVSLDQAKEQYRLAKVRFTAGVTTVQGNSPLLEISDAQTALTQAQTNEVNARYDVQSARAKLDRATGRYAETSSIKGSGLLSTRGGR